MEFAAMVNCADAVVSNSQHFGQSFLVSLYHFFRYYEDNQHETPAFECKITMESMEKDADLLEFVRSNSKG